MISAICRGNNIDVLNEADYDRPTGKRNACRERDPGRLITLAYTKNQTGEKCPRGTRPKCQKGLTLPVDAF